MYHFFVHRSPNPEPRKELITKHLYLRMRPERQGKVGAGKNLKYHRERVHSDESFLIALLNNLLIYLYEDYLLCALIIRYLRTIFVIY
jgi:hypothetical protein